VEQLIEQLEPIWLWLAAAVAVLLVLLAAVLRARSRSLAGRLGRLAGKVAAIRRGRNNPETFDLLRQLYSLAHAALAAQDEHNAYRAVDLVKTVYGHGIARPGEAEFVGALAVRAARAKHPEIASTALDALRLLLRRLPPEEVPAAAEQLTNIAAAALREKYNFLAAKAADIIFDLLEKTGWEDDQTIAAAALRILKTCGVLILRRRDGELFREIITRLDAALPTRLTGAPAAELAGLTGAWLHRIIQNDDTAMYDVLAAFVARKAGNGLWASAELSSLVREWNNLAGIASLRPRSVLAPAIAEQTLRLAHIYGDGPIWEAAVTGAGQTARLAVERHGLADGFALALPLFELGRELLALELKFGSADNAASFRQQALYLLVRETLALAEYIARRDMVTTAGDILAEIHRLWLGAQRANPKAAKRYCQLLAAFWLRTRGSHAKRAVISDDLAKPALLTESDKQRLGFLL
jgi:hypothetical protein